MKTWRMTGAVLIAGAVAVVPASADVWDVGTPSDNTVASQNELLHGSRQTHDLIVQSGPAADVDWYRIGQPAYSSWEVTVEGLSANAGFAPILEHIAANGTTVVATAPSVSTLNFARSLRIQNASGTAQNAQYVRVSNPSCGTTCTANDIYHLRAYETTYAVSRFNNSGTQNTALIIQNTAAYPVGGTIYFWSATGALLGSAPLETAAGTKIPAKQVLVLQTAGVSGVGGQSGSVTIVNDGRYGDLVGKAVSIEPATSFTFDTQMVARP